ncbi:hypothetical protein [Mobiluncus curtisii]|uniref:hypothetical protein n=1 Tax=Mobiluncus curtisii TaxID=2051 RepID=UPI00338EC579
MEQAGAAQADVVVASTGNDQANLVIGTSGQDPVRGTSGVGRINNPKNEWDVQ